MGEVEHPWGKGRFLADAISDMHVLPVRQADEKSEVEKLLEVVSTQIFCNKVGPSTSSFGSGGNDKLKKLLVGPRISMEITEMQNVVTKAPPIDLSNT